MKYTGAEIIIKMLEKKGIETIAGIPGGANLPLYRALSDSTIRHVLARHEQGAGFIAQGMARSTGKAAVCFATSGPGVTNLLTAIADAKLDSVPVVAFTGQVPSSLIGTDAFQEIDTYGLTVPITKHNFLVRSAEELLETIPLAFHIAESGRPGPVVIDVPKNVQQQEFTFDKWPEFLSPLKHTSSDKEDIKETADLINASKYPILIIGGGIIESGAEEILLQLAEKNSIPVTSTLRGLGCFPQSHKLYLGMLGMHGTKYANRLLEEADLVIALGTRFDDRATGKASEFLKKAKIIHIDIDKTEINKIKPSFKSLNTDIKSALEAVFPLVRTDKRPEWLKRVDESKTLMPYVSAPENGDLFHPLRIISEIAGLVPPDTIVTTDVGQHQMWVAQAYPFKISRTFLTSGGLGTMGFGVPAAIGAALSHPDRKIICFSGDGSFLMNIQELATIADLKLNLTIILLNNGTLGLVRQQQELFYEQKYIASQFHSSPDYAAIARGFGIYSVDLANSANPLKDIEDTLSFREGSFINVPINYTENVFPMVPPGSANYNMIG